MEQEQTQTRRLLVENFFTILKIKLELFDYKSLM